MELTQLNCCAIQEIGDLSDHDSPEAAMAAICSESTGYGNGKLGTFGGFMLFSALVKTGKTANKNRYGHNFAEFIAANDMGTLVTSPVNKNSANHPTHSVQVWLWCPNMTTIRAWWTKNKKKFNSNDRTNAYDYRNEGEVDDYGYYSRY